MNKSIIAALLAIFIFQFSFAQDTEKKVYTLPNVDVRTLDGKTMNTKDLTNNGKPMIVSFWALWCKPCIKELTTIAEVYPDWVKETGVKLVAVSIDDARSTAKVQPFVDSKDWEFQVILDPNGDFKRALNVNMVPHTFVLNGKGEIVWQHTSFSEGAELELINIVRKVIKGEPLDSKE
ncbi:MAG: TlpA disulfide reductase family protein [Bacteroidota bacterium]